MTNLNIAVPHRRSGRAARRQRALAVAVALCAAVGLVVVERATDRRADAAGATAAIEAPAAALQPAVRLGHVPSPAPPGRIAFPVDPADDCYVLDNFGDDRGGRPHIGTDIMGSRGNAVYAVADGVLAKRYVDSGEDHGAGWGWTLRDDATGTSYKYFHLSAADTGHAEGDRVRFGDVIGYVGNSGTSGIDSDTNYHLHFEYWPSRSGAVDPLPLLEVPSVCGVSPPIRGLHDHLGD